MFNLDHFQKLSKGSFEVIECKKSSILENAGVETRLRNKNKNNQVCKYYKNNEYSQKIINFHSQRNSSEIIDRILMKGALSNFKSMNPYTQTSTAHEFDDGSQSKLQSGCKSKEKRLYRTNDSD